MARNRSRHATNDNPNDATVDRDVLSQWVTGYNRFRQRFAIHLKPISRILQTPIDQAFPLSTLPPTVKWTSRKICGCIQESSNEVERGGDASRNTAEFLVC
ncbi:unnamed protein product [Schistosoma intercalatum]|nr:unnamed protein product [Schistosoma intercalatum]